jgi:predicted CDP-diglyceride synthetase/phosphatidate cytidylyltransferase
VCGFQNLAAMGVDHFNGLFKESNQYKMDSILKQLAFFLFLYLTRSMLNYTKKFLLKN